MLSKPFKIVKRLIQNTAILLRPAATNAVHSDWLEKFLALS